ncbi:hypothetical protein EDB81DRAFT_419579 [Dactylonectria macrodidyma]|uniref:Uncharacterized protein n=1 Tax=Dactylonectria macrodidyma TaxID=307937 RepID=A0A9P9I6J4_9HYPO|nr:hypothetical protein EDB81DRAFT_419579 [Dactylonectria macrodidyma]
MGVLGSVLSALSVSCLTRLPCLVASLFAPVCVCWGVSLIYSACFAHTPRFAMSAGSQLYLADLTLRIPEKKPSYLLSHLSFNFFFAILSLGFVLPQAVRRLCFFDHYKLCALKLSPWEAVQQLLLRHRRTRGLKTTPTMPILLTILLLDNSGILLL